MNRIICTKAPRVKPTRRTARSADSFGAGILRALPNAGRMPFTPDDEAWFVENVVAANPLNRHYDQLARESRDLDRLCGSYCL